ncbi:MAG: hypothetical protein WC360_08245 [Opitutales bacterium]|jgi:preprotein translocase subunit SecB
MTTLISLDGLFVTRLNIDWRQPTTQSVDISSLNVSCDYDVAFNANDNSKFKMDLRLKFSEVGKQQTDVGYIIEADMVGLFSFPQEIDIQTRHALVRVNGVSILYSSLRGILATVSGLFPAGKFTLPSISPQDLVKQVEELKGKQASCINANGKKKE